MLFTKTTIANLRATVTDASVDYVGSITIDNRFCDALGLVNRQLIQIRNDKTGVELHTYIIYGALGTCPPGTVCLNGAAAHLVSVGDVVSITAYANVPAGTVTPAARSLDVVANPVGDDATFADVEALAIPDGTWAVAPELTIPVAVGKVHRPRITGVRSPKAGEGTNVSVDAAWAAEAGLEKGREVHLVNTNTGQRDVLAFGLLPEGSKRCEVVFSGAQANGVKEGKYGSRSGHNAGDVIIVMAYSEVPRIDIIGGKAPMMRISFPFEAPVDAAEDSLNLSWHYAARIVWDEKKLAKGLIDTLGLLRPGLKVLDASCGNAFPAYHMVKMGAKLTIVDGSPLAVKIAKQRLAEHFGPDLGGTEVRCLLWDQLADVYGEDSFDVVIWRGNSLPFVGGDWSAPTSGAASNAATGYQKLITSAQSIFKTLAPGGCLYLDCVSASAETSALMKKQGNLPAEDGGDLVKLEWHFTVDQARRACRWESKTMIFSGGNGKKGKERVMECVVTSLLVREQEIRSALAIAGFGEIQPVEVEGETFYQPFVTCKPVVDVGAKEGGNGIGIDHGIGTGNGNGSGNVGHWDGSLSSLLGADNLPQLKFCGYNERQSNRIEELWKDGGQRSFALFPRIAPVLLPNAGTKSACSMIAGTAAMNEFISMKLKGGNDTAPQDVLEFSTATSLDSLGSDSTYGGAFSREAISHVPAKSRAATIEAISAILRPGSYFVISDVVDGAAPVSAAAQLHFKERLAYEDLWNVPKVMSVLKGSGLNVVEYFDLSQHCAKTYEVLSNNADSASRAANGKGDSEAASSYETLEVDYSESAKAVLRGEIGWSMFVCQKATTM